MFVHTPVVPLPVVVMARGAVCSTYLSIWDFAVLGSPINSTFMSPRNLVPFSKICMIAKGIIAYG